MPLWSLHVQSAISSSFIKQRCEWCRQKKKKRFSRRCVGCCAPLREWLGGLAGNPGPSSGLQQPRYADVDRRCRISHSLRLALVPCLTLTGFTGSMHLGIPNLGGRGQMRRTSSSCASCWVASREGQQGVHSEPQGNCRTAVGRAFLADTFDVLHIHMYRNAVNVVESFGSSRAGDKPPPRTEDLHASHVPVSQERLSPADTSFIPQDNFCKDMSLHLAETF